MKYQVLAVALALFAISVFSLTDEQKETMKKNHEECLEETEADREEVKKMREGDYSNDKVELQKYVFCMFHKSDLITDDGEFKKDVAMSKLGEDDDKERIEKAIDQCKEQEADTPHGKAFLMMKCFHEEIPDHNLF